ncbi:DNA adenine methylase [Lysinibacillus sp. NPDC098008]|uniref:DNA adenine methylase n=1 Tax=Lysinibacillus sp. NPDC098008 TaxID=3364146 RepID=UPI00381293C6
MKRVLNYSGSKWRLAKWLVKEFPSHEVYLEPFFGSGALFFTKESAAIETINDVDGNVTNLFRVIRDNPVELAAKVELTPYSKTEYLASYEVLNDIELSDVERARVFLVRCWMAHNGKTATKTSWRHNLKGDSKALKEWNQLPEQICDVTNRLKSVQIESMDAVELIARYNRSDCFIYADPPYLRSTKAQGMYFHEMTIQQHINFLEIIKKHSGPAMISGYANDLYDEYLVGWKREVFHDKEIIWKNY